MRRLVKQHGGIGGEHFAREASALRLKTEVLGRILGGEGADFETWWSRE
jgi:hypothetical protein